MKESKSKKWLKQIMAMGLSVVLSVSLLPMANADVMASGKKNSKTAVTAETVDSSGNYELMNEVQGSNILHCWNWSYSTIEDHMALIAECGYTAIQTSPAQQPKDYHYEGEVGMEVGIPGEGGSGNWWKLYQPVTFDVCDNGETWLGTKAELESMCATAEQYGIKVIVDIVANHMGNITGWKNSLSDVSPQVGEYWNPEMMTDASYWHINALQVWMSDGREDFTQGTMGMPDLNTQDKRVQKYVYDYLDELIDCGVDGFRFDAAKHIETPDDDASYAGDFWPTVLGEAKSHYQAKTGGELYVYGEVLNTVGDNFSIDSYTKYMSVTDNSAGNHLLEAFRNNNPNGLSMDYAADKSVLWAESHDTYMNESSRYASDKSIVRTWAIVGNKKDAASLFFVRPYYSADVLEDDRDGSFKGNLKTTLEPAIMGECETYVWASKEVAAINHFNNRFASVADNSGTDGNIAYCQRGNGIILVNFNGAGAVSTSAHGMPDGSYTDEVSGNTFQVSGGTISGNITSEYGIAVVYSNPVGNPTTSYPIVSDKAVISSTLSSGAIHGEQEVTFSVSNADSANYSVDGGAATSFNKAVTLVVGKDLEEGEKCIVKITAEKAGKITTQTYTYTMGENKPILSILPGDGTSFEDTLDIVVTAENAETASYQIGDEEAVAFTKSATITIGEDMAFGDNITITISGRSSNGKEATISATYTKEEEDNSNSIFYKNTNNWDKVTVYAWNDSVTPEEKNQEWPGEEMTLYDAENGIYTIDFGTQKYNKVIFSNNGSSQTANLELTAYGMLYDASTGQWTNYEVKTPKVTASLATGTIEGKTEVTFTVTDAEKASIKVNNENEQTFTNTVTITVGENTEAGGRDTVVVTAVNGTKTTTKTFIYTMKADDIQDMSSQVKISDYNGVYDGNMHSVEVEIPEGAEISFADSENGTYTAKMPEYKNAGDYTVYYQVTKVGYATVTGNAMIHIEKKEVIVSGITGQAKKYDGTTTAELDFSQVKLDGVLTGDEVSITAYGNFQDAEVGTDKIIMISNIVLQGASANNYQLAKTGNQTETVGSIEEGTFAEPTPTSSADDKNSPAPAEGTASPVPTAPTAQPKETITPIPTAPTEQPKETISPTPTNHVENTPLPTPDIGSAGGENPSDEKMDIADKTIALSNTTFSYNAKVQKPKVVINGLTENEDYQVSYSSGCKKVGVYTVTITGIGDYTGTVTKRFSITIKKNSVYTVGNYQYKVTNTASGKTVSVTGATKKTLTAVTVKKSVNIGGVSFKVTAIASKAFANFKKLKKVTIGSNVKKIAAKAFYGDTKLKKIVINSKVLKTVNSNAVKNIYKKATIKVPSAKYAAYKKLFKSKTGFKSTMKISK